MNRDANPHPARLELESASQTLALHTVSNMHHKHIRPSRYKAWPDVYSWCKINTEQRPSLVAVDLAFLVLTSATAMEAGTGRSEDIQIIARHAAAIGWRKEENANVASISASWVYFCFFLHSSLNLAHQPWYSRLGHTVYPPERTWHRLPACSSRYLHPRSPTARFDGHA